MHYLLILFIALFFMFGIHQNESNVEDEKARAVATKKQVPSKVKYNPNQQFKSDSQLRKDAESAVKQQQVMYNYYASEAMGGGDYRIKLYLLKIPRSGYSKHVNVFAGIIHNGNRRFRIGTNKPSETKKYPRTKYDRMPSGSILTR